MAWYMFWLLPSKSIDELGRYMLLPGLVLSCLVKWSRPRAGRYMNNHGLPTSVVVEEFHLEIDHAMFFSRQEMCFHPILPVG